MGQVVFDAFPVKKKKIILWPLFSFFKHLYTCFCLNAQGMEVWCWGWKGEEKPPRSLALLSDSLPVITGFLAASISSCCREVRAASAPRSPTLVTVQIP